MSNVLDQTMCSVKGGDVIRPCNPDTETTCYCTPLGKCFNVLQEIKLDHCWIDRFAGRTFQVLYSVRNLAGLSAPQQQITASCLSTFHFCAFCDFMEVMTLRSYKLLLVHIVKVLQKNNNNKMKENVRKLRASSSNENDIFVFI